MCIPLHPEHYGTSNSEGETARKPQDNCGTMADTPKTLWGRKTSDDVEGTSCLSCERRGRRRRGQVDNMVSLRCVFNAAGGGDEVGNVEYR